MDLVQTFKTKSARTMACKKLQTKGYNYFVMYQDKNLMPTMQIAIAKSDWVKKQSNGKKVFIEGE